MTKLVLFTLQVSTIGAAYWVVHRALPVISLQQVIDCAKPYLLTNGLMKAAVTSSLDDGPNIPGCTVGAVFVFSKKRGNAQGVDYALAHEDPMQVSGRQ